MIDSLVYNAHISCHVVFFCFMCYFISSASYERFIDHFNHWCEKKARIKSKRFERVVTFRLSPHSDEGGYKQTTIAFAPSNLIVNILSDPLLINEEINFIHFMISMIRLVSLCFLFLVLFDEQSYLAIRFEKRKCQQHILLCHSRRTWSSSMPVYFLFSLQFSLFSSVSFFFFLQKKQRREKHRHLTHFRIVMSKIRKV